jgi:hypothetical protein
LEKPRKTKEIQCRYVINGFLKNTGKHQKKKQKTAQQQQQQQHQTCLTTLLSANANAKLHTKFSKVVRIFGKQIHILQKMPLLELISLPLSFSFSLSVHATCLSGSAKAWFVGRPTKKTKKRRYEREGNKNAPTWAAGGGCWSLSTRT